MTSPEGTAFKTGSRVTLTATASSGWKFHKWWGDADSSSDNVTITMDSDKVVQAEFIKVSDVSLPLAITCVGEGRVLPFGGSFVKDSQVTLTAMPPAGWTFYQWRGDVDQPTSGNPLSITMDRARGITAVFQKAGTTTPLSQKIGSNFRVDTPPAKDAGAQGKSSDFQLQNLWTSCALRWPALSSYSCSQDLLR